MTTPRATPERVAVITGATGGIGRAVSQRFARDGYAVGLIDISQEALEEFASEPSFAGVTTATITCDVADAESCESSIQRALAELGRVDALINCAGIGAFAALQDMSVAEIDAVLDVDSRAPILLTRAVVPHMIERGSGSIVSISSAAAKIGYVNLAPYSAAKAALIGFTRALAAELAPRGVRVNAICPGPTNTPMMGNNVRQRMEETGEDRETALLQWTGDMPTKIMVEPEEVADSIAFLVSDSARSITGEALNVSGGLVMW